jgi:hypothetical protein
MNIVSFSTGLSSAITTERVLARYGRDKTTVVFMDTKIEDEDNYRFMADCKNRWDIDIVVLADGRDPYEVSRAERVIPNSHIAPCTHRLKIEVFKRWLETQEKPTTIHIGYDFTEMHRMEATKKNYNALGFEVDFPLLWKPYEFRKYTDVVRKDWNIEPPRMYALGYTHANCGGRCVKQGQGDWIRTLINFPDRFCASEKWENEMRQLSEKHGRWAILKSQTPDGSIPLTLSELRERYENKQTGTLFEMDFNSACVVCGVM